MGYAGFLSSLKFGHEELRRRVHELGKEFGGVYVAEIDHPVQHDDPFDDADRLLRLVREAPVLFCVLGAPHHGTDVGASRVSFFEIELFQAAVLQRDVHVIEYEGFSPGPELSETLAALRPCLSPSQWTRVDSDERALSRIRGVLSRRKLSMRAGTTVDAHSLFATSWWRVRSQAHEVAYDSTPVRWLGSRWVSGPEPDRSKVEAWLEQAQARENREQRLARLWYAIRELMGAPFSHPECREYRDLWRRSLSLWWATASWYGLHGHALLGPLASGQSVAEICRLMRDDAGGGRDAAPRHPHGSMASSYYSIAKLLQSRRGRRWYFHKAEVEVKHGLSLEGEDHSGLRLLEGSIHFRQWRPWAAVESYSLAVKVREARGADHELGEALSELGFALIFTGRFRRGRALLQQGVKLLEESPEPGFLFRAQRKLAVAELLCGRFAAARRLRSEARAGSARTAHFDQTRQV